MERRAGGRTDIENESIWIYCKRWETITDDRNEIARETAKGNVLCGPSTQMTKKNTNKKKNT